MLHFALLSLRFLLAENHSAGETIRDRIRTSVEVRKNDRHKAAPSFGAIFLSELTGSDQNLDIFT